MADIDDLRLGIVIATLRAANNAFDNGHDALAESIIGNAFLTSEEVRASGCDVGEMLPAMRVLVEKAHRARRRRERRPTPRDLWRGAARG